MEKQNNLQLELFSHSRGSLDAKNQTHNKLFFNFIRNYEKAMLVIIGIAITSIISFSLGVKRGKELSTLKNNGRLDVAYSTSASQAKEVHSEQAKQQEEARETPKPKGYNIGGYTIQLASYQTKKYAEREAESLKKKGYNPLVLSKGKYTVLCVGNFTDKTSAQPLISEFEKRYRGCYLRRL